MTFTDPQAAAAARDGGPVQRDHARVGGAEDRDLHARVRREQWVPDPARDGERLTGAYALGPEAGEWLQQATLAIRARVPVEVLRDTIQPFPTFSEIYVPALKKLLGAIAEGRS